MVSRFARFCSACGYYTYHGLAQNTLGCQGHRRGGKSLLHQPLQSYIGHGFVANSIKDTHPHGPGQVDCRNAFAGVLLPLVLTQYVHLHDSLLPARSIATHDKDKECSLPSATVFAGLRRHGSVAIHPMLHFTATEGVLKQILNTPHKWL